MARRWKKTSRPRPVSDLPPALVAHFSAHNRNVILLAVTALVAAAALWVVLYGLLYMLIVFYEGMSGRLQAGLPRHFEWEFTTAAVLLCATVFLLQLRANVSPPRDHKPFHEHATDVLLMVPRMTLFVWNVLRAYQFLSRREMRLAWRLLQRIQRERRVSISTVPLDIPNGKEQQKILMALQIVELVDINQRDNDLLLRLKNDKARALCQHIVRIDTGTRAPNS